IERQQDRTVAGDTESVTREMLEQISAAGATPPELESVARELAIARKDLLGELVKDSKSYTETLEDLEDAARALYEATAAYQAFISERILWVRSISGGRAHSDAERRALEDESPSFAARVRQAVGWHLERRAWADAWSRTKNEIVEHPSSSSFIAALLIAGHLMLTPALRRLRKIGKTVGRFRTDALRHTIEAFIVTMCASWPTPVLIWVLGWLLTRPTDQPAQAVALGMGLRAMGLLLIPLLFMRAIVRPGGIADDHFRWPQTAMRVLRRHLRWFIPVFTPLIAVVFAVDQRGDEDANATLGRLAFTAAMIAIAVFLQRILRPSGPVLAEFIRRHEKTWINRLRYVWYPMIVAVPLALIVVAWLGYYYTSIQLQLRFELTLVLILALILVNGMLMRWLFVARRKVAVEDAKRRRTQTDHEQSIGDGPTERTTPSLDEDKLDLPAISLQTTQLFRVVIVITSVLGLYAIWADVLPALRMLDRVIVFPEIRLAEKDDIDTIPILEPGRATGITDETADTVTTQPKNNGAAAPDHPASINTPMPGLESEPVGPVTDQLAVTLADLGLAAVLLIATLAAFRNLPGLIEIAVLQRLPLDAGSRYALSTVIRYLIAIIGIAAA
ncbi:MAG: hypothetical protein K8E66_09655, partial [Phycisphaerales bacterium]|nr:hypothetical protein [Phycisphaerales bacterium]